MPGSVIGNKLDYGYPGQASRHGDEVSRTHPVNADSDSIYFGDAVALLGDGSVTKAESATSFAGFAMRRVKSATIYPTQNYGFYSAKEPCDVLERGSIMVNCAFGTPTIGGNVYIATQDGGDSDPAGLAKGAIGADSVAGATAKLDGVAFSSTKDGRGVAEVTIKTRQGV